MDEAASQSDGEIPEDEHDSDSGQLCSETETSEYASEEDEEGSADFSEPDPKRARHSQAESGQKD